MQCKATSYFDAGTMKCVKRTTPLTQTTKFEITIDAPETRTRKKGTKKPKTQKTTPAPTRAPKTKPPKTRPPPKNTHETFTVIESTPAPTTEPPTDPPGPPNKPGQREVFHLNDEPSEGPIRVPSGVNIISKPKAPAEEPTVLDHAVELLDTGAGADTPTEPNAVEEGPDSSTVEPMSIQPPPPPPAKNAPSKAPSPKVPPAAAVPANVGGTGSAVDYSLDGGGKGLGLSATGDGDGSLVDLGVLKSLGGKIESYAVDDGEEAGEVIDEELV